MSRTGSEDTHLSVEVEDIECEETHAYLNVFHLYILPLAFAQLLERHQLTRHSIYSHGFRVQHERFCVLFDALYHFVRKASPV